MSDSNIILYIATSLDGYIARLDGSVDWLFTEGDYGYDEFFETIGKLYIGRKTYEQILGFELWPYAERQTYVFSHDAPDPDPHVVHLDQVDAHAIRRINGEGEGHGWLVGGGGLIASFREADLIDEMRIFVHPILLGSGIPLFESSHKQSNLRLLGETAFSDGLISLHYKVCRTDGNNPA